MLIAVLTRRPAVMAVVSEVAALHADCDVIRFENRLDLIRHLLGRSAVDLVMVDTSTDLDAVSRLSAWRMCHGRSDFAIMVIAHVLPPVETARIFAAGCDDMLLSGFNANELYARACRCVARVTQQDETFVELGSYTLDKQAQRVTLDGEEVALTAREFAIAWLFFLNPGVLLSKARIAADVWGSDEVSATLGRQIHSLRRKLGLEEGGTMALKAVYSEGYRLEALAPKWEKVKPSPHQMLQ